MRDRALPCLQTLLIVNRPECDAACFIWPSQSYSFGREFSHERVHFYSAYAIIDGLEVDEKLVELMATFQQFSHFLTQNKSDLLLICRAFFKT